MIILQKLILNSILIFHINHWLISPILLLLDIDIESAFIRSDKINHINVCPVNIPQNSLVRVDSHTHSFIYSDSLDPISWLDEIDQIFINTEMYCVRGLAFRDRFWGLLKFHMLLIREVTSVVHHLEGISAVAIFTIIWLKDTSSLDKFTLLKIAFETFECCLFHLRNDITVTNHNTLN